MPQLLITCPRKHRPLPTNVSLAAGGYAAAAIGPATSGPCPHCGEDHAWTKADAYLPAPSGAARVSEGAPRGAVATSRCASAGSRRRWRPPVPPGAAPAAARDASGVREDLAARIYGPLGAHLAARAAAGERCATLPFATIEGPILGRPLPPAARQPDRARRWWRGKGAPHAWSGWLRAGWQVADADLAAGTVTFVRPGGG